MHDLLSTTVIGSYPQPNWLVDRQRLQRKGVPRVRAADVWRVEPADLVDAQNAAVLAAIRDQERAGIDIITDGEMRRESYFNHFATSLDGVDPVHFGERRNRVGGLSIVPLVNGPLRRRAPVELEAARFLRESTSRRVKVTVPGPFTLSQLAQNDYYRDQHALALAFADVVNEELADLAGAGIDVVQLDEPYLQANAEAARVFAVEAIDRAVADITATTVLHTCFGYAVYVKDKTGGYPFLAELADSAVQQVAVEAAQPKLDPRVLAQLGAQTIVLGVIDLGTDIVETADEVAARVRIALDHIPAARLVLAPDCGMKFMARDIAFAKLAALSAGTALVRSELTSDR